MTNTIHPCLWFDGQAKAAADFYCSIFTNSKITASTPMVVTFELNGNKLMGLNGGPMFKMNPSISLFVTCKSVSETNAIWARLIDGGSALMPLDQYPWSERYGWLQDKFGMTWQISVATNDDAELKIKPSMLFTGSQFGRAGEAIQFYSSVFDHSSTEMLVLYPAEDQHAGKVMYSEFKLNQYNLIAMDGPGVHDFSFNEAVSFVVECETQEEIDYYWTKLTEGGQESMCGWLKDKFNVSWQIVPKIIVSLMSYPEKVPKVMQAVLNMKKLDIETLIIASEIP
ncbi:MAG: VOC family protein [Bacteroidota bacterium]|nr:VOC family protein [Bacteroidota bacterium]